jgi:ParB/RepB/Spo0J family partition protein
MKIKLSDIKVEYNPRSTFDIDKPFLESIKRVGLLVPLTVGKQNGGYKLLDGQRRYMACQKLGISEVEVFVKDLDEQEQKEVPMVTDLLKSSLPVCDKAVGFAHLINKDQKYTVDTIATRFNIKKSDVKKYLKLATLHPKVQGQVNSGSIDIATALQIAEIRREDIQIKVATACARGEDFLDALQQHAYLLPFDDVCGYEQAKKDKQIGICVEEEGTEIVFTYDKKYYEEKKADYELREQKSYEKVKAKEEKQRLMDLQEKNKGKADRKGKTKKAREYKVALTGYLKKKPTQQEVEKLIEQFVEKLTMDSCKYILKAWQFKFKVSDFQSNDYDREVKKILTGIVKDTDGLAKLILAVGMHGYGGATMWDMNPYKKLIGKLGK